MKIRIGSRESKLAVIQSEIFMEEMRKNNPGVEMELITMKTTGDKILDRTLDKVGGKGLFLKELEQALLEGKVDLTVHSLKDMAMDIREEIPILAVSKREDPRDVLVLPQGAKEIDFSKPFGCASLRRKLQIQALYPGAAVKPVRGNVLTRLAKLDAGEYCALILAYAGMKRLHLESRIHSVFEVEEILPSACQGVLAVQGRKDFDRSVLSSFHDEETFITSMAERSFVRALDGGCSSPVAAYAQIQGNQISIAGFFADDDGNCSKDKITGPKEDGVALGQELANIMKRRG
ncbi:MAG: hydroxymethylbilane synthase [Firmicutes bacterium]|nr:hydroxymethylbilane synthase [Bacillota bacterium]